MKDRIVETPIVPDGAQPEHNPKANNYAVLGLPVEYGNQAEIQQKAVEMVKAMDLQGKYDTGWDSVPLRGLDSNASPALDQDQTIEPLVRYYATLAKSWGFTDSAQLHVYIQSDKDKNPNNMVHRDGVGAKAVLALEQGKHVRTVRFVYPIGRPGTILYPDLDHAGSPYDNLKEAVIENPSEDDHLTAPHAMSVDGEEKQRLLDGASAVQLMPGATLAFDMTSSPWHVAPEPTQDGAVMTVGIVDTW